MTAPVIFRALDVTPGSYDPETRTLEAVVLTAAPVTRRDGRGPFLEVIDLAGVDLAGATDLPVYDDHRAAGTRSMVGRVVDMRLEGEQVVATLRLSGADHAAPIRQLVEDGTARFTSSGYRVAEWTEGRDASGRRTRTAIRTTPVEVSLTPSPADRACRIRNSQEGTTMEDTTTTAPDPQGAEQQRRSDIRALVRSAGLGVELADQLVDDGATLDEAKGRCFDAMQTRSRSRPVIRSTAPANDDPATIVRRQSDALAYRAAGGECPEDARQYVGLSLLDLARDSLARDGVSTRGLSADEVLTRATAMHTTSDFPAVVSNAANKIALGAYRAAESPLKRLCRQRTLPNFKPSESIRLGNMGRLEEIAELGEITHTSRGERGEAMRLKTYARGINLSRQLLIDDDLGLLGDVTRAFGEAAAQTEADILVDLVTGNPALSDGLPVFDANRGNVAAAGVSLGAAGDLEALEAARRAMRGYRGLDGVTLINVAPRYLLVGPEGESAAERIVANITPGTVADVNPLGPRLQLLVEPRIEGDDWFVFSDPARLAGMQFFRTSKGL